MRFLLRSLDSLVIAVCLAGTLGSCARESAKSGISGHTSLSAGCEETIESTPCGEVPLPARIRIVDALGATVRETTSNGRGEFREELPPGTYELHAVNLTGTPLPSALPEHVVVGTGAFTEVNVRFDSGVR